MNETNGNLKVKTPWHVWVVGVVSLLWNAIGGLDHVMTITKNEAYMSQFTPEQLEYFYAFPAWVLGSWGIAVWGGVLGSLALLFRSKLSSILFLFSLVAMVATTIYNFVLTNGLELMGTGGAIFSAVIFIIAVLLLVYAWRMQQRRILR